MAWLVITFGGMILFAASVAVYDWLARREHRRKHEDQRRSA
jgi:hypothetical protein